MPRRYHAYPPEFQVLNVLSTAGASILGGRLPHPADLLRLLADQRREGGPRSVGRERPRMGDPVAAADRELHRDADRHRGHAPVRASDQEVTLPERTGAFSGSDSPAAARPTWTRFSRRARRVPAPSEAAAPLRRHGAAGRGVDARHVGVPRHRDHVLRRAVHGLPASTARSRRPRSRRPARTSASAGAASTRRS